MKIVIKLDKRLYKYAKHHTLTFAEIDEICDVIANGTPLPEGAEILTKEAYSDLCTRAADVPGNTRKRTKTHACDCISRQAAIDTIGNVPDHDDGMVWEALSHAQRDVALLPSVEPEKRTEERTKTHACVCISRDAAIDAITHELSCGAVVDQCGLETAYDLIKELPPVEPERKKGRWIRIKPYPLQMHDYECSECLHETDDNTEEYCSACGAKMEVDTNGTE